MHSTRQRPLTYLFLFISLCIVASGIVACQQADPIEEIIPPLVREAPPDHSERTLVALLAADPPARELADLAERMLQTDVPTSVTHPDYSVGSTETFWYKAGGVTNLQVEAELRYQSDQLNLWIEDGARVSSNKLEEAAAKLEDEILPTTRDFFGTETSPGIDGDRRINILHLKEIGGSGGGTTAVGYFYAADQYPKIANEYSNEREIFYISLRQAKVGSDSYYKVIAHEFEHMIHAKTDRNEPAWSDEGLAELSNYVNGFFDVESVDAYAGLTDVQLNDWSHNSAEDISHYGASFLFSAYFLNRYGEDAMKALVANPANGLAGYSATLADVDPSATIDTLFSNWVADTYLSGRGLTEGYDNIKVPPLDAKYEIDSFPTTIDKAAVHQYGVDFVEIASDSPVELTFTGSQQVKFLDTDPQSGDYLISTYPADRSDMTLTRAFDLTAAEPTTTTLSFWTWYQIESGWDYGYTLISTDDGATWDQVRSIYHTEANPQGNNYGVAITGNSGIGKDAVWAEVNLDITEYVGQEILVRFEYITDDAVFEAGWAIDDISLPAIGYFESFEDGIGDWEGAGWVRHANILPQTFLIQALYISDDNARVEPIVLSDMQDGTFELALDGEYDQVVLAISGNTPVTTQSAAYTFTLSK